MCISKYSKNYGKFWQIGPSQQLQCAVLGHLSESLPRASKF